MIHAPTGECCPACGSRQMRALFRGSDRLYRTTDKEFSVVECSGCRLLRLHPWPSVSELSHYYPESYWFAPQESTVSRWEENYRRIVLTDHVRFVAGAVAPNDGPVLDLGCGGALFGRLLAARGYKVFGLDYSQQAAQVGWRQNGVPVATGLFTSAPFAAGTFGAITMFHVLEHLYDPGAYLEMAWHLLRPGGRLVVQVPNAASWQCLLFGEHWNGFDLPRHLIDFRAADVQSLVAQKRFKILRTKHFSLRDNPAGFASSLAPGLDPMARRVRGMEESPGARLVRNLAYLGILLAAIPFAALEAACGAGSTVMIDARKAE
ncbi:MAG TPA: methyltransferase domain-containing protein [Bryobacteraceae bacterium]|nr:methyltransferase domain-containing protein [Bryobacteraceae bacterium]